MAAPRARAALQQLRETAIELQLALDPLVCSTPPAATLWAHFQGGDVDAGMVGTRGSRQGDDRRFAPLVDSGAEVGARDHILIVGQSGPVSCEPANRARCPTAAAGARPRRAMCAASAGAISPRETAARTADSTCRKSSTVRNDDRSIPRRSAGSMAASGGGKSCAARGRNRCGLRSSRSDSACALSGRAARSGTRRFGLGMPRGRPRGLPELPLPSAPRASRAGEAERDQAQAIADSWNSEAPEQAITGRRRWNLGSDLQASMRLLVHNNQRMYSRYVPGSSHTPNTLLCLDHSAGRYGWRVCENALT